MIGDHKDMMGKLHSFIYRLKEIVANKLVREEFLVAIADLMMPYNGEISAIQYLIVSRIMDLEQFLNKSDDQRGINTDCWALKITKLLEDYNTGSTLIDMNQYSFEENNHWRNLLASYIDGYDCKKGGAACLNPLYLIDGTHRMAIHLLYGIDDIQVKVRKFINVEKKRKKKNSILYANGDVFEKIDLLQAEREQLYRKYNQIMDTTRQTLTGYIKVFENTQINDQIFLLLNSYGEVTDIKRIRNCLTNNYLFQGNLLYVFQFKPEKQRLLYKNKQLKSVYIEKLEEEIKVILIQNQEPPYGWGYIAHSITESKSLDKFMEVTRKDKNESS